MIKSLRSSFTQEGILKARQIEERLMLETWLSSEYNLLPKLKRLSIPTLVIHGDYDIIPVECAALRTGLEYLLGDQLEAVYLYGSQARGDARPDSDIDVLVVLKEDFDYSDVLNKTSTLVSDLSLQNDTVITCVFVTKAEYLNRRTPLLINVRREGIKV